jgi:hypothetical protein
MPLLACRYHAQLLLLLEWRLMRHCCSQLVLVTVKRCHHCALYSCCHYTLLLPLLPLLLLVLLLLLAPLLQYTQLLTHITTRFSENSP